MKSFETSTTIDAAPERVWDVLADTSSWRDWDSGVVRVEGELEQGTGSRRTATGTRVEMREEFSGPLSPLVWRSMPDMNPSFRQFAEGLKQRVEA